MLTFWILGGVMAALIAALLVLALLRGQREAGAGQFDLQVYKDQLREIDRDLARGTLPEAEAERLRTEVSKRLLAADARAQDGTAAGEQPKAATLVMAALSAALVVGGGFWMYGTIGAPGYQDLPLQGRIAAAEEARLSRPSQAEAEASMPAQPPLPSEGAEYAALVDQLRETLKERPDDLRGLALLARSEASMNNFTAAHEALARIIEVKGDAATSVDYADLTDMLVIAAGGYVSPEAEAALTRALEIEPRNGVANYYAGLMLAQTGRPDLAFQTWDRLLRISTPDAPWLPLIYEQIEELAFRAGVQNYTPPQIRGPSAEDLAAAQDMSPEERMEMARGMVDQLSQRLATEGGAPQDWARLISALMVLGESDRAGAILTEAREVFAEVPQGLALIERAASEAGLAVQLPGPSAEDIEAAQDMSAEDRAAMIRGMVDGLEARLADEGGSAQEWARLVRTLGVLGEVERARAAFATAQGLFADDAGALAEITSAATEAGLQ